MGNPIRKTCDWFVAAGQQPAVPVTNPQQMSLYTGLMAEELAEKLALILGPDNSLVKDLEGAADRFKKADAATKDAVLAAFKTAPQKFIDADMDMIWVSVGATRATGSNPVQAYGLVGKANWAKFPGGKATLDSNGKVVKPADWQEADLTSALPAEMRGEA